MIKLGCPKDCPLCRCGSCHHVCQGQCYGSKREKQLSPAPVYSQPEREPIARKADFCLECRKPYDVTHSLQRFCSQKCGRKVRNRNNWSRRESGKIIGVSEESRAIQNNPNP